MANRPLCQFPVDRSKSLASVFLAYQTDLANFIGKMTTKASSLGFTVHLRATGLDWVGDWRFSICQMNFFSISINSGGVHQVHMDTEQLIVTISRAKINVWSVSTGRLIGAINGLDGISDIFSTRDAIWTRSFDNELAQWGHDLTLLRKWLEAHYQGWW